MPVVSGPIDNVAFVAIKMSRRQGARRRISESIRNRRATQPPAHFHRNPPGRGQLVVFLRCSLLTYQFRYARRSRLEKQLTDRRRKPCYLWDRTLDRTPTSTGVYLVSWSPANIRAPPIRKKLVGA